MIEAGRAASGGVDEFIKRQEADEDPRCQGSSGSLSTGLEDRWAEESIGGNHPGGTGSHSVNNQNSKDGKCQWNLPAVCVRVWGGGAPPARKHNRERIVDSTGPKPQLRLRRSRIYQF